MTPLPTTPLDRLTQLMQTGRCEHCGRADSPTPDEIATRLGVSGSTVRSFAKVERRPQMATLDKMAYALGMPFAALYDALYGADVPAAPEPVEADTDALADDA